MAGRLAFLHGEQQQFCRGSLSIAHCQPIRVDPVSPRGAFVGAERIQQSGSRDTFLDIMARVAKLRI
jgi:hypothetical protein